MIRGADAPDTFAGTEPGRLLAGSLYNPKNYLGLLLTGALEKGELVMQSVLLAQGDGQAMAHGSDRAKRLIRVHFNSDFGGHPEYT